MSSSATHFFDAQHYMINFNDIKTQVDLNEKEGKFQNSILKEIALKTLWIYLTIFPSQERRVYLVN